MYLYHPSVALLGASRGFSIMRSARPIQKKWLDIVASLSVLLSLTQSDTDIVGQVDGWVFEKFVLLILEERPPCTALRKQPAPCLPPI
jgi:hypothetical protein